MERQRIATQLRRVATALEQLGGDRYSLEVAFEEIGAIIPELEIDITTEDLEELMNGEEFNWVFYGVRVHLFNPENEDEEDNS